MNKMSRSLESRLKRIEDRLKRIGDILELSPTITTFEWKDFNERDKGILNYLLRKERQGATTFEIAEAISLNAPETSGRTIVYRRLKRIERISRRIKGISIVIPERKRWYLNYDDFQFHVKEAKINEN